MPSTDHREAASRSMRNQKRLKYLKASLDKAKATIRLLEPTPSLDICLVEKMKKDVDMLTKKLSDTWKTYCHSRRMILPH